MRVGPRAELDALREEVAFLRAEKRRYMRLYFHLLFYGREAMVFDALCRCSDVRDAVCPIHTHVEKLAPWAFPDPS